MTPANSSKPPAGPESEREMSISRIIDAPVERVWRAWTDPAEIVQWWGPHGFRTDTDRREFKVGGFWKHTMIGPDGTRFPNAAHYEEIVPLERIVFTNGGGDGDGPGVHFRSTVTFKDLGGKTELTMRSVFDTAAMRDIALNKFGAIEGGRQTLSRLAAFVQGEFVISRLVRAPRERVWKAWTDQNELAAWFGPKGFETRHAQLDFRPGGLYHYCIRSGGLTMWAKWVFREIESPSKLTFMMSFSDQDCGVTVHPLAPEWPKFMLTSVLFQDFGPSTLVTIYSAAHEATDREKTIFREGIPSMQGGWTGTFERLEAHLGA